MGFVERFLHTQDDVHKRRKLLPSLSLLHMYTLHPMLGVKRFFSRTKLVMRSHSVVLTNVIWTLLLLAILMLKMNKDRGNLFRLCAFDDLICFLKKMTFQIAFDDFVCFYQ